jgi:maleylpyruvate isomerase
MEDGFPHLDETVVATARYLAALTELTDDDVRRPSLLPGWTRAHVIAHLARNADGLTNVLHGAQAGEVRSMYPSEEARDADIEAGARGTAAELRADAVASARRWVQAANELHVANLENQFRARPNREPMPVRRVGILRRTEVEVHHVDLGTGYTAADWPPDFVDHLVKRRKRELETADQSLVLELTDRGSSIQIGSGGPTVSGSAGEVLWWLLGRGGGEGVACSSGQLPELGKWA